MTPSYFQDLGTCSVLKDLLEITELVGLEEMAVGHLVHPPCLSRVILQDIVQDCVQAALEYFPVRETSHILSQAGFFSVFFLILPMSCPVLLILVPAGTGMPPSPYTAMILPVFSQSKDQKIIIGHFFLSSICTVTIP